jgi:hypothetical protein
MSERQCLREKIDHTRFWIEYFDNKIEKYSQIPVDSRGHRTNERIVKMKVTRDHFMMHLEILLFDESQTEHYHIDKVIPVEVLPEIASDSKDPDSAYSI